MFFGPFQQINISPAQIHGAVIALFASVIAPFGGFFASGLKRGLKIKDFADSIPGHGGFADRFDCHIVIAFFVYIYLTQIVYKSSYGKERIFDYILQLDEKDRYEIFTKLSEMYNSTQQKVWVFSTILIKKHENKFEQKILFFIWHEKVLKNEKYA